MVLSCRGLIIALFLMCHFVVGAQETVPKAGQQQYRDIAELAKLWSFVKYSHPETSGRDWDDAFVTAVRSLQQSSGRSSLGEVAAEMLATLADPVTRIPNAQEMARQNAIPRTLPAIRNVPGETLVITVGNADYGTTSSALNGFRESMRKAKNVIFDLRYSGMAQLIDPTILELSAFSAAPNFARRVHYGYASPDSTGPKSFRSVFEMRTPVPVRADAPAVNKNVVFLINEDTTIPDFALAMQEAGTAAIVAESGVGDEVVSVASFYRLPGDRYAFIRTRLLVHSDGSIGFVPNEILNKRGSSALDAAVAIAQQHRWVRPVRSSRPLPCPDIVEKPYSENPYPDQSLRMLAAVRIWEVFTKFHPYAELGGENWDELLPTYLRSFSETRNAREYHLAVADLVMRGHDSHSRVRSGELGAIIGYASPPFQLRWVERQLVITSILDAESWRAKGVRVGDTILTIDGRPVEERIEEIVRYTPSSTRQYLMEQVAAWALLGPAGTSATISMRGANGSTYTVTAPRDPGNYERFYRPDSAPPYKLLKSSIGYVDLTKLRYDQVDAMFDALKETRGIIMDLRGYPNGTAWSIAPRLAREPRPIAALIGMKVLYPDEDAADVVREDRVPLALTERYSGRTVLLLDGRSISQAEHSALMFRAANGSTIVGATSAGTDGDATWFWVPGGIRVSFTAASVRWPDGRQLQRVGIVPDIPVEPTIEGIRGGRDEVLEKALDSLDSALP